MAAAVMEGSRRWEVEGRGLVEKQPVAGSIGGKEKVPTTYLPGRPYTQCNLTGLLGQP